MCNAQEIIPCFAGQSSTRHGMKRQFSSRSGASVEFRHSTGSSRSAYCKQFAVEPFIVLIFRSTLGLEFLLFWLPASGLLCILFFSSSPFLSHTCTLTPSLPTRLMKSGRGWVCPVIAITRYLRAGLRLKYHVNLLHKIQAVHFGEMANL